MIRNLQQLKSVFFLQFMIVSTHRDEEEMVKYLSQKYGDMSSTQDMYGDGEEMADEISQQGLLPGVK